MTDETTKTTGFTTTITEADIADLIGPVLAPTEKMLGVAKQGLAGIVKMMITAAFNEGRNIGYEQAIAADGAGKKSSCRCTTWHGGSNTQMNYDVQAASSQVASERPIRLHGPITVGDMQ